jgi:YVTN family beta-propeller protein
VNSPSGTVTVLDGNNNYFYLDTITVGDHPEGIAVDEFANRIYVTNTRNNTVSVIDGSNDALLATVGVGQFPVGVAVDSKTQTAYVTNAMDATVSVIDSSFTLVDTIPVGQFPVGVAVDVFADLLYVTDYGSNTIAIIDTKTDQVTGAIAPGTGPLGVTIGLFENPYFVISAANSVLALYANSGFILANIAVGQMPMFIARNRLNERMFVTNFGDNTVSVLDGVTNKNVATVKVDPGPLYVASNDTTGRTYVTHNSIVTVIEDLSPQTPIVLKAANQSRAQVTVRWQDSCPECAYAVERATALGGFIQIGTTKPHHHVFQDRDVQPDTTYYYRVRAFHTTEAGEVLYSGYSDILTATTPPARGAR